MAACRRISSPTRRNCTTSRPSSPGRRGVPSPSGRARRIPTPTISPTIRWPEITRRARRCCGRAISFIFLLGGTAIVLLAFGKFDYLGWHGTPHWRETVDLERLAKGDAQIHGGGRDPVARADLLRRRRRALSRRSRLVLRHRSVDVSSRAICCARGICSRRSSGSRPPMSPVPCSWPSFWVARARAASRSASICSSARSRS